ncbi:MAG: HD domain-containing protein [Bacteroidetes bacterium]|nr:HD domain-containing protein [Bacteroidota bacterium]
MNKLKIINDPVYGLVEIPFEIIYDLIEHPVYQRLRRISQLGLTGLVYPGALHTRFHHAIGAMHIMQRAIATLRNKGVQISEQEHEAVSIAILLHDIGHGPYSHALENSLIKVHHEEISLALMQELNQQFSGKLNMAIEIFQNKYSRKFFHQLISGQVDMDRLDYLRRDSFYTGVSEGTVGIDRIIQMLNVKNDELVVEEKSIYSIEKFIMARRLMYWQVYFHKTVIAAESLLINILKRAKYLASTGKDLFATSTMHYFLYHQIDAEYMLKNAEVLKQFSKLDDFDMMASIKEWANSDDKVLAMLCQNLAIRKLPKVLIQNHQIDQDLLNEKIESWCNKTGLSKADAHYFIYTDEVKISAYSLDDEISILMKNSDVIPFSKAAEIYGLQTMPQPVVKYYICYSE